ncbi:hypothetical protein B0H16DRAFT_1511733 [Mycena metata]|uniref:Uncharacterized protein n=1 Tax=Mycena metata TaxID=1033252 RepID=A0AAD7JWG7_9AGAR|nr:hypothetical protein B0H16DRAFT_1511733 [Mycena metata]
MQELNSPYAERDEFFQERLDAFCLGEMKAFAEREHRNLEETRQHVAEWHSRHLFSQSSASPQDRLARVKSVLSDASRILESLCAASGVQSFLLAVDPSDPAGSGFLGGSVSGREYWRGHRGGGDAGVKAFKVYCLKNAPPTTSPNAEASSSETPSTPNPKIASARSLKADLYDGVRNALRSASGVHNAEMKWTNPALLAVYGVCLVGWPPTIPAQNPSSLKANQNKELLQALESGTMHFVRTLSVRNEPHVELPTEEPLPPGTEEEPSYSWAIQFDDDAPPVSDPPAVQDLSTMASGPSYFVWDGVVRPSKRPRLDER